MNTRIATPADIDLPCEPKNAIDTYLLLCLLIILCIGLIAVLSSSGWLSQKIYRHSFHFFYRQIFYMGVGGIAIVCICAAPRSWINKSHYIVWTLTFILLLACLAMGTRSHGAQRWIGLGFLKIQPMEFARVAIVLYLSYFLSNKQNFTGNFLRGVLPPLIATGLLVVPIFLQPDLGGAFLLVMILLLMLIAGGSKIRYIAGMIAPLILLLIVFVLFEPYRLSRWLAFRDPFADMQGNGWQLVQSLLALGSGGVFGVGIGEGIQKTGPLPEAHNDFIMAVIGEETGFIGIAVIMLLFAFFFYRCYLVIMGQQNLRDRLCAFGSTIALAQSFLFNLAVILGSVPPKGVAMPFISYGGSSLVANMIFAGLILHYSRTSRNT